MFCPMIRDQCKGEDCYWFDNYGCAVSKIAHQLEAINELIDMLDDTIRQN